MKQLDITRGLALAAFGAAAASLAQTPAPTVLVATGDQLPGFGQVSLIGTCFVHNDGRWCVHVWGNGPTGQSVGSTYVVDGVVRFPTGTVVSGSGALPIRAHRPYSWDGWGNEVASMLLQAQGNWSSLWYNGMLAFQETDVIHVDGMPNPQTVSVIGEALWTGVGRDYLGYLWSYGSGPGSPTGDKYLAKISFDAAGNPSFQYLVGERTQLPGQSSSPWFGTSSVHWFRSRVLGTDGELLWYTVLRDLSEVIYLGDRLLAQTGAPSPIPGRSWLDLNRHLDRTATGGHVYGGVLSGDPATAKLLVKNDAPFVQTGMTLPDIAPYTLTDLHSVVSIDDLGRVLWAGRWDHPDPSRGSGLFLDHELLLESGVTTAGGVTVGDFLVDERFISKAGSKVIFEAILSDGRHAVCLLDLDFGATYCGSAVPNSTGFPARVDAMGSPLLAVNSLALVTRQVPPNQWGYYLVSRLPGFVPTANVTSNGNVCLGATIGRFNRAGEVRNSGAAGSLILTVDLLALPQATGPVAAQVGEQWSFQAWHRDSVGLRSNFSDAITVTIQ